MAFSCRVLGPHELGHPNYRRDLTAPNFIETEKKTEAKPRKPWGKRMPVARRRARKVVEVTHRWTAFTLGLALLAIVLSGVVVTFGPEIHNAINGKEYSGTETDDPIPVSEVLASLEAERPNYKPADVVYDDNTYSIYNSNYSKQAHFDPATGEYLGVTSQDTGFMGFMRNMHFCAMSCKAYPGYVGFLNERVKDSFAPVFGNGALTWGGLILAVTGLLLIFLSIGGIWLWWPSIKRFARGFKIRRKGTYKFNYDLHKVVGIAAIPFLLMWGWTGAGFEIKQIEDIWYAVMPGDAIEESEYDFVESDPKEERAFQPEAEDGKVTVDEAQAIGQRIAGDDARWVSTINAEGKTGAYDMYFADNSDPYEYGNFPGDLGIAVDRYSGRSAITYPANPVDRPLSQTIWEDWNYSVHAGFFANAGWRIFWGIFGLAVLLLAVTSIITWVIRFRKRRRQGKKAGQKLAAEAADG